MVALNGDGSGGWAATTSKPKCLVAWRHVRMPVMWWQGTAGVKACGSLLCTLA